MILHVKMKRGFTINITANKCCIRAFTAHDIEDFMIYRNDLEWMKYQGFKGLTKAEYEEILLKDIDINKGVQLAMFDRQTNKLVGDLFLLKEDNICWIGYTITPLKARQGYAFDAVLAMINELKKQGIKTIKAGVLEENIASVTLLKKLGFVFDCVEENEQIYKFEL